MSKQIDDHKKQLDLLYFEYKKNASEENRLQLLEFWNDVRDEVVGALSADSSPDNGNIKELTKAVLENINVEAPDMEEINLNKSYIAKRNNELISEKKKRLDYWGKVGHIAGSNLGTLGGLVNILIKIAIHLQNDKIKDAQKASDMLNNLPEPLVMQEIERQEADVEFANQNDPVELVV